MSKAVSIRTRFEIFKRDNFICAYCGRTPPAVVLHVDHILPVSKGGTAEKINLITSCADCNLGKSDKELHDKIQPLADQVAIERERSEQLKKYNKFLKTMRAAGEKDFGLISAHICNLGGKPDHHLIGRAASSVKSLLKRLPVETLMDMADIADSRIGFTEDFSRGLLYFYGCCHNKIKGTEPT